MTSFKTPTIISNNPVCVCVCVCVYTHTYYIYIYIYHNAYLTSGLQFAVFGQQPTKRPSKIHIFLVAQLAYYNNVFISCYEWVIW